MSVRVKAITESGKERFIKEALYFGIDDACGDTRGDLWSYYVNEYPDREPIKELHFICKPPIKFKSGDE